MSEEFIHTGHRVFFGSNRVENEVIKKKVTDDEISNNNQEQEKSSAEDIAARIANDRQKNHDDILEKARNIK